MSSGTSQAFPGRSGLVVNSFEAVARVWHTTIHSAQVSWRHASRTLIRLEQDVFPELGGLPIGEIKPPQLLQAMRRKLAHAVKDSLGRAYDRTQFLEQRRKCCRHGRTIRASARRCRGDSDQAQVDEQRSSCRNVDDAVREGSKHTRQHPALGFLFAAEARPLDDVFGISAQELAAARPAGAVSAQARQDNAGSQSCAKHGLIRVSLERLG